MYTEGFEQWFKMNKNLGTPLNDWNKACTEICRRVAQQNMEIIGENFTRASERLKRLSSVRKPEDLFNLQKDCFNEDVSTSIELVQKFIHTSMENIEEFTKLCGNFTGGLRETTTTLSKSEKERERSK